MSQKRKSRHGVHRIPRKDSEFDAFIRNTTAYLLSDSLAEEKKPESEKMPNKDSEEKPSEDENKIPDTP